ncbi:hypothetical protein WDL1CHR_00640 [Variovorax sp. WDL1]|nr:hypothetical protein CHC07_02983 [Variovorax sp. B4]PNG57987.1 hypothetical protein CHC06_02986 [Variovorax sp. B2]VTV09538.1 hypothetical protein WDL1CHR_00640 [Variovorax sp. WDL1]
MSAIEASNEPHRAWDCGRYLAWDIQRVQRLRRRRCQDPPQRLDIAMAHAFADEFVQIVLTQGVRLIAEPAEQLVEAKGPLQQRG